MLTGYTITDDAVVAVRRAGFSPCVRAPGGRAVAYTTSALVVDHVSPDPEWPSGLEGRFDEFPRSTPDAITSGAIQAGAGAIAQLRDAMARLGLAPGRAILSGGAAGELAPHLPIECSIHENLVLDGLALIARHT